MHSYTRTISLCSKIRSFSNTTISHARRTKSHPALPIPSNLKPKVVVPEDHALWGFFRPDRQTISIPADDKKHGRSWTAEELRKKSFDDLHSLWIICLKERNILSTQRHERRRQRITEAGGDEAATRDRTVRRTMAGIKFVLNERFLAYTKAVELARQDGTIKAQALPVNHKSLAVTKLKKQLPEVTQKEDAEQSKPLIGTARKADMLFRYKAAEAARVKNTPVPV
ncbi:54S ribosomal protein L4,mitochondrial [Taphrina deformans PYCC 5710]|uniref:Large ribosomal subunit protein uL29m n=1 Tax=Taphrina deformans (strain PYCC 5710 / ATCC 11124 / CBS 356.35 / IMI 108563 / JCM 9778 / NBRC 8474) TaxID=1097556 RepID=R4XCW9_TAPDE|nr:54S ribosomal protein L4,mitochondrial [Taphrina deformans PYCC 5710]|eukprot:CCG81170.1 54S ribosomal protein L4,mitochondrial [Taphrina deformans PYCC 5710]